MSSISSDVGVFTFVSLLLESLNDCNMCHKPPRVVTLTHGIHHEYGAIRSWHKLVFLPLLGLVLY